MLRHLVLLLVVLTPLSSAGAQASAKRVVLVSIDGFAAYELDDPELDLPNLRTLIAHGVRAESSETVYPSVTHPGHTTLVTGVRAADHGVIGNQLVNRDTGERFHITNKPHAESVRVRTLFDAAHEKGIGTAAFYWPENRDDPSVDFNIPEVFDGEAADPSAADPAFLAELRNADVPIDLYYRWYLDPFRKGAADAILAEAAAHVIREHEPGFVAVHLLVVDEIQHEYGTDHYRSKEALTAADHALGILVDAVHEAGLADETAFFIVSDHGFQTVEREVNLRPVFAKHGLLDRVELHSEAWTLHVESVDPVADRERLEAAFAEALVLPGVARVLRPHDFTDLGFPLYEDDPHVPGQFALLGDVGTFLVSDASSDTTEPRLRSEPYHGHGYLPSHPRMHTIFVASGAGVRRGLRLGHVRNLDVAPTIAHLLGVDLPDATGTVLQDALSDGGVEDIGARYLEAIQTQDWDEMASYLTETSHYQDFTMEYFERDAIDLTGAMAITEFWRSASQDSGTSEIRYEVVDRFEAGPAVVYDIMVHVTTSGAFWKVDQPEIELSGRLVTFLRVEDGKVTHHIDFTDYAAAVRQAEALR